MMKHIPGKIKDKYKILSVIGEGAYGVVLKARNKNSNALVAIKQFKQPPRHSHAVDVTERELKILQSLRFENVVELIEWFREKKQCFLVFEYVEWNMLQVLQQHPEGLAIEQVRQLSYQLFRAIHWCHTHEIIHRDIKPENLLISKNFVLKLCDFGFARFCNTQTAADYYTDYVATRWYRSPELLIGSAYGKPVDIWACGCIIAELSTGQALFAGESDIDQLYRIQKCIGPLPAKYIEAMRNNPKFDGLKFPPIHHLETLERRFGHLYPPEIMHLFKNTLRLYALDRPTAGKCLQHEAFIYLNQTRTLRAHQRPKSVYGSVGTSQFQNDYNNESTLHAPPLIDQRLSKSYDENNESRIRHRPSENLTDISFATTPNKYRTNTQINDQTPPSYRHQPKTIRIQSRTHSSSSTEQTQPSIFSLQSSNETSDNEDEQNNLFLRRKYLQIHQALREQQLPRSPLLRHASNGVLIRSKQPMNVLPISSNDMSKTFKQFSLDQQQTPESTGYRSSVATIVSNQNTFISFKPVRDELNSDVQQQRAKTREINRDLLRSRGSDCHVPATENTSSPQRTPARQNLFMTYPVIPDLTDQTDGDSAVSSSSRNFEEHQSYISPRNTEQRRSLYTSDSRLLSSTGQNSSFNRTFHSPTKNDSAHTSKLAMTAPRDSTYEPIKSTKLSAKPNLIAYPKTSNESQRKQRSNMNSLGVYPFARTAILHVANALLPPSHHRQQSTRFSNPKSRHHDG